MSSATTNRYVNNKYSGNGIFRNDSHQYFDEHNDLYQSVTTFLKYFEPAFDLKNISKAIAKRDNIDQNELCNKWLDKTSYALSVGNEYHDILDNQLFKLNPYKPEFQKNVESYLEKRYGDIKEYNFLHEKILAGKIDNLNIAGTADLIVEYKDTNTVDIVDWKTNSKFTMPGEGYNKMYYPFDKLDTSHFNKYSLQLSTYAFLIEKFYNKVVNELIIYHIDKETNVVTEYKLPYHRSLIITAIEESLKPKIDTGFFNGIRF